MTGEDLIRVLVNGAPRQLPAGTDVCAVVRSLAPSAAGTAVAVNGEVLPRTSWPATTLAEGDEVEVLTAVQGG